MKIVIKKVNFISSLVPSVAWLCNVYFNLGITDKSTTIRSHLIDKENHPNHRVVGEIAGQLESRIVQYVFAGLDRKSSYGTIVRNIPEVIEISCFDREHKQVNVPLQFRLVKRFAYVKTSLRPFGYNFDFHPQFSIDMASLL